MSDRFRIALAQINPVVGDMAGNAARIRAAWARARAEGADLVVLPECAISGYPPEDLVLKPAFQARVKAQVEALAAETADGGPAILLGAPWLEGGRLYNTALVLDGGRIAGHNHKHQLPNYGVFDEARVFAPGPLPVPIMVRGVALGVLVCEDMWAAAPARHLAEHGAQILISINASPYEMDKPGRRRALATARVAETGVALLYLNQVGGQDELVFDGHSFVVGRTRDKVVRMASFAEDFAITEWRAEDHHWDCAPLPLAPHPEGNEAVYRALMLGLADYVDKNGFPGVVLGLSGGIDSALSAAVAVDALGADRVRCVMMPSPYTSDHSLEDAAAVAAMLGTSYEEIPIAPAMSAFAAMLTPAFAGRGADVTEENIQARIRGLTLMALSNKFGHMLLTTGNKSEMSVGYATLYGDMCGGYSVLKDVYKTAVFELSRWRNAVRPEGARGPVGPVMPVRVIDKPPSAELKPDQTDQDSLPPYDVLDDILNGLIEGEHSVAEVAARGHDPAVVARVWRMLDLAEYKRRQAPPGVKITNRAFGRDRRYPITNAFKG